MSAFIDTNVLLDVLAQREPFYIDSARVWTWAETGRSGHIAAVSVTNLYYIVRKLRGHGAAMEVVRAVRKSFEMVACDGALVDRAMGLGMKDFEDGIQYASAERAGARWLVTRNVAHYPADGLAVVTPTEFWAAVDNRQ